MAYAGRMFRVFISSTFSDFQVERDTLQRAVFPKLRELCRRKGARFQVVDLRWGVSEEASLDQQTMTICLDEIHRSQRVSPRPNILVLLGDRYGTCIPPAHIAASEFTPIYQEAPADERQWLDDWYRRDDNAVPPEYSLRSREDSYSDDNIWAAAARILRTSLLAGTRQLPSGSYDPIPYLASVTEQEIRAGVLDVPDADRKVCCFFRRITNLDDLVRELPINPIARQYVDLDEHGVFDAASHQRLEDLKARLRLHVPRNVYEYEARWTPEGVSDTYLTRLCDDLFEWLKGVIEEELANEHIIAPDDREIAAHEAFAAERARHFTGRADILRTVENYILGTDRHPLIIYGDSGSGKSTLLACVLEQAQREQANAAVVARFIGITPASSDERALLQSLCRQIAPRYGRDEAAIPTDLEELVQEFPKLLALATAKMPLVVLVDALDQLRSAGRASSLSWLFAELPAHVRLIASTTSGATFAALKQRLPAERPVKLEPMSAAEGKALLDLWLADAHRTLLPRQMDEVLGKFAAHGLPLYLKLAFEEARRWKSCTPFAETTLARDIPGILHQLFDRLAAPANHGNVLVRHSLGYLGAAKEGLSEDEMLAMLSLDHQVIADFREHSPKSPKVDGLPIMAWSRLFFDLEPYLTERAAEGATLMTFYHRQLAEVAAERYLMGDVGRERHRALAAYFSDSDVVSEMGGEPVPNVRKLAELPYQQAYGELWDELFLTLTDFRFLEQKAALLGMEERTDAVGNSIKTYAGPYLLQEDFALALQRMPGE